MNLNENSQVDYDDYGPPPFISPRLNLNNSQQQQTCQAAVQPSPWSIYRNSETGIRDQSGLANSGLALSTSIVGGGSSPDLTITEREHVYDNTRIESNHQSIISNEGTLADE